MYVKRERGRDGERERQRERERDRGGERERDIRKQTDHNYEWANIYNQQDAHICAFQFF